MSTFAQGFSDLHLLKHPFYQDWMAGRLSRETLRDYASQYYSHVEAFPRYISSVHSLCADASVRKDILLNLNDEEGLTHGKPHPDLWLQFAEGIGAPRASVIETQPRAGIQNVISTFFAFSRASFHEGLGALYAYESQIPEVAASKIQGLIEQYGVSDAATLEFFEVHREADIHHRAVFENIIIEFSPRQRMEAANAARTAAQALWAFLSEVHDRQPAAA